jgi:hypothetical protein
MISFPVSLHGTSHFLNSQVIYFRILVAIVNFPIQNTVLGDLTPPPLLLMINIHVDHDVVYVCVRERERDKRGRWMMCLFIYCLYIPVMFSERGVVNWWYQFHNRRLGRSHDSSEGVERLLPRCGCHRLHH